MSNIQSLTAFAMPAYGPTPRTRVLASTAVETGAPRFQGTSVFAGAAAAKADLGHRAGVDMGIEPTQGTHVWSSPPLR